MAGVKFNSAGMAQTINEITTGLNDLNDELKEVQTLKQRMQSNLTGAEADQAYAKLEEMEKSLSEVIENQNINRKNLLDKKNSFDEAATGL